MVLRLNDDDNDRKTVGAITDLKRFVGGVCVCMPFPTNIDCNVTQNQIRGGS